MGIMQADRPEFGYYINTVRFFSYPQDWFGAYLGLEGTSESRVRDASKSYCSTVLGQRIAQNHQLKVDIVYGVPITKHLIRDRRFHSDLELVSVVQTFTDPETIHIARFLLDDRSLYNWKLDAATIYSPTPELNKLLGEQVDHYRSEEERYSKETEAAWQVTREKAGLATEREMQAFINGFMVARVGTGFMFKTAPLPWMKPWDAFNQDENYADMEARRAYWKCVQDNLGESPPKPVAIKVEGLDDLFANTPITQTIN